MSEGTDDGKPRTKLYNTLEKWDDDFTKGLKDISDGFAKMFKIPPKSEQGKGIDSQPLKEQEKASGEVIKSLSNPDTVIDENGTSAGPVRVVALSDLQKPEPKKELAQQFEANWNKFTNSVNQTFEKMKNDMIEFNKRNNEKFIENNAKINEFFANQKQVWDDKLAKMKVEMAQKDQERREAWIARNQKMHEDFNNFVKNQQKSMQKSMDDWNKMRMKAKMKFWIWLIPIIAIVIFVLYLVKYFDSLLPG